MQIKSDSIRFGIEVGKEVRDVAPRDLVLIGKPHGQYSTVEYGENERNNIFTTLLYFINGKI